MKVAVNKYLNARSADASVESPCSKFLSPGESITVKDVIRGSVIEGNGIWYLSADDGCYYWSGGTENSKDIFSDRDFSAIEWMAFYKSALHAVVEEFSGTPGFGGVSIGSPGKSPALCFFIYLDPSSFPANRSKIPATFPYRGLSFGLIAEERIPARFHTTYADQVLPLALGGSISGISGPSAAEKSVGTRSALVYKGEQPYLLCCYHVACDSLLQAGKYSVSPSDGVLANLPSKSSGSSVGIHKPQPPVVEGSLTSIYDYALVQLDNDNWTVNVIIKAGAIKGAYEQFELEQSSFSGLPVRTFGAISGYGTGTITRYEAGAIPLVYSGKPFSLYGLVECTRISAEGDSGAPVVDNNGKLIGFVLAGNPTTSYILPFATLSHTLGLSLTPTTQIT